MKFQVDGQMITLKGDPIDGFFEVCYQSHQMWRVWSDYRVGLGELKPNNVTLIEDCTIDRAQVKETHMPLMMLLREVMNLEGKGQLLGRESCHVIGFHWWLIQLLIKEYELLEFHSQELGEQRRKMINGVAIIKIQGVLSESKNIASNIIQNENKKIVLMMQIRCNDIWVKSNGQLLWPKRVAFW